MKEVYLEGVVGLDIMASDIKDIIEGTTGDITFDLNSGGGYVTEGIAILNMIRNYNKGATKARVHYAASMMTQIALACDEVEVYDNSIFMIHNVQGMAWGDHVTMREQADKQERMSKMLASLYIKKTGLSAEEIATMMDNDTYLFGEEIKEKGFADSVIETNNYKNFDDLKAQSDIKFKKSMEAMNAEKVSKEELDEIMRGCNDNCTLEATPTAKATRANTKNQGEKMELPFNEDNFKALQLAKQTSDTRLAEANANLDTAKTALETKDAEIVALKDAHDEALQAKAVEARDSLMAVASVRVAEAMENGIEDAETIIAMLKAENDEEASKIVIGAKASEGLLQGDGGNASAKEGGISAYAEANKGKVKI